MDKCRNVWNIVEYLREKTLHVEVRKGEVTSHEGKDLNRLDRFDLNRPLGR